MTERRPSASVAMLWMRSRPCRPHARASRMMSHGTCWERSYSGAAGRMTSAANRWQWRWNSRVSSLRRKSMAGESNVRWRSTDPASLCSPGMPRRPLAAFLLACAALFLAAGCGKSDNGSSAPTPQIGKHGSQPKAAQQLGFPTFATRNTTRVGGADPVADAAAVAQAVFPGTADVTRPGAVTLVDSKSWQDGVAAGVLFALPPRAPLLLTQGGDVPEATASALKALSPRGEPKAGGAP